MYLSLILNRRKWYKKINPKYDFLHNLKEEKSLYIIGRSREFIFINTYIKDWYIYLEFLVSTSLTFSFSEQTTTKCPSKCQVDNLFTYNSSRAEFYKVAGNFQIQVGVSEA